MSRHRRFLALAGAATLTVAVAAAPVTTAQSPSAAAPAPRADRPRDGHPRHRQPVHPEHHRVREDRRDGPGRDPPGGGPRGRRSREQIALIQGFVNAGVEASRRPCLARRSPDPSTPSSTRASRSPSSTSSTRASRRPTSASVRSRAAGSWAARSSSCWVARRADRQGVHRHLPARLSRCSRTAPRASCEALATAPGLRSTSRTSTSRSFRHRQLAAWEARAHRQPGREGVHRPVRAGHPEPRPAPGGQPGHRLRDGWLRPDAPRTSPRSRRARPTSALARPRSCRATCPSRCSSTRSRATTVDLSQGGFVDAGTEIVTKDSVDRAVSACRRLTFDELEAIAADPAAARAFYQPLVDGIIANWADDARAHREREQVARTAAGGRQAGSPGQGLPSTLPGSRRPPIPRSPCRSVQVLRRHPGPRRHGPRGRSRAPSTRSWARTAPASPRS